MGLFVTCLVDLVRPGIGFAALELLEAAGCEVVVPEAQTCCGQPHFNSGFHDSARELARHTIRIILMAITTVLPVRVCHDPCRD